MFFVVVIITLGFVYVCEKKGYDYFLSDLAADFGDCGGFDFSAVVDFDIVAALDLSKKNGCHQKYSISKNSHCSSNE